ncbi:Dabb family protein [Microbacterium sp. STN6]|uniref:Dabb family protein n=1 Tax=Microbacterium sp. STN6 TaxID=2995588 RepID=UPI0022609A98|nr:Dabb family protein [Microbacterium sp. STN6]MCX7520673.1 Dabb family protein [Microbacterium sp. STN6]
MTLRHIVTWKLAETDPSIKADQLAQMRNLLTALPAEISEVRALEVGINDVPSPNSWDIVLIADYDDAEALRRYDEHPAHQKVAAYNRQVVAERSVVNFTV